MHRKHQVRTAAGLALLVLTLLPASIVAAQSQQPHPAASPASVSEEELSSTRQQLFKLLRMSPRLTAVVSRDPSLLADQEYVSRNNPELAQFLQQHPEIVRNPEFYLFAHVAGGRGAMPPLEQFVWPDNRPWQPDLWDRMFRNVMPFFVMTVFIIGLLWLLRLLLENRRWSKVFQLQGDLHGKLLEKFGNSQELLSYINSEAGKRFLEAAPMSVGSELTAPAKMSLARVLTPLQLGVVLTLAGAGFLGAHGGVPVEGQTPMLVLGMLGVTIGIGFIISAALAFLLARHLDLLPKKPVQLAAKEQL